MMKEVGFIKVSRQLIANQKRIAFSAPKEKAKAKEKAVKREAVISWKR